MSEDTPDVSWEQLDLIRVKLDLDENPNPIKLREEIYDTLPTVKILKRDLQEILVALNLPKSGNMDVLRERIEDHLDGATLPESKGEPDIIDDDIGWDDGKVGDGDVDDLELEDDRSEAVMVEDTDDTDEKIVGEEDRIVGEEVKAAVEEERIEEIPVRRPKDIDAELDKFTSSINDSSEPGFDEDPVQDHPSPDMVTESSEAPRTDPGTEPQSPPSPPQEESVPPPPEVPPPQPEAALPYPLEQNGSSEISDPSAVASTGQPDAQISERPPEDVKDAFAKVYDGLGEDTPPVEEAPESDVPADIAEHRKTVEDVFKQVYDGIGEVKVETPKIDCPTCGALIPMDADKCPSCGDDFSEPEEVEEDSGPKVLTLDRASSTTHGHRKKITAPLPEWVKEAQKEEKVRSVSKKKNTPKYASEWVGVETDEALEKQENIKVFAVVFIILGLVIFLLWYFDYL